MRQNFRTRWKRFMNLRKSIFFLFLNLVMDIPFPCISSLSADHPDQRRSVKTMRYKKGQGLEPLPSHE